MIGDAVVSSVLPQMPKRKGIYPAWSAVKELDPCRAATGRTMRGQIEFELNRLSFCTGTDPISPVLPRAIADFDPTHRSGFAQ